MAAQVWVAVQVWWRRRLVRVAGTGQVASVHRFRGYPGNTSLVRVPERFSLQPKGTFSAAGRLQGKPAAGDTTEISVYVEKQTMADVA